MINSIALDIGASSKYYIKSTKSGKQFVKEYIINPNISILKGIEKKILPRDKFHRHILREFDSVGVDQELKTWGLWKSEGIKTLDLIKNTKNKIIWKYLPAPSLRIFLEDSYSKFEENIFKNYLNIHSKIRNLAKEKENSDFFHNDPWLKNYLVFNENVIPIDPGVKLNKEMSIKELDTRLNRISLYSIINLDINKNNKKNYIEMFRETLTNKEAERVMDFNSSSSALFQLYFKLREEIASKINKRSKNNISYEFEDARKDYVNNIFFK